MATHEAANDAPWILSSTAALEEVGKPDAEGFQLFRKEIARVGEFVKANDLRGKPLKFAFTKEIFDHFVKTHDRLRENGVEVTAPEDHSFTAEKNRGYVLELAREGDSLFGKFRLDPKGAQLAKKNGVSLYSPPVFVDGKGNVYRRPLLHAALTPHPVIPGLKPFEAVAASFAEKEEQSNMDNAQLIAVLGLEGDDWTDEKLSEHLKGLQTENLELSQQLEASRGEVDELKVEVKKAGEGKGEPDLELKLSQIPDVQVDLLKENREGRLAKLVENAKVTPACVDDLREIFCSDDHLRLSFVETAHNEQFKKLVDALERNDPVALKEKSGPQAIYLSQQEAAKKDGKGSWDDILEREQEERKRRVG